MELVLIGLDVYASQDGLATLALGNSIPHKTPSITPSPAPTSSSMVSFQTYQAKNTRETLPFSDFLSLSSLIFQNTVYTAVFGVIVGVVGLCIIGIVTFCIVKRYRKKNDKGLKTPPRNSGTAESFDLDEFK